MSSGALNTSHSSWRQWEPSTCLPSRPSLLEHPLDGRQRVALEAIVHIEEGLSLPPTFRALSDELGPRGASFRVGLLHAVIRLEQFHRLLILAAPFEQAPR